MKSIKNDDNIINCRHILNDTHIVSIYVYRNHTCYILGISMFTLGTTFIYGHSF